MADIFICYCRRDTKKVTHWVRQLQDRGYSVWMDLQSVEGATLWAKEIVEAIDGCKVLVVMLSKSSIDSANVVKEVSLASEKGKPILPLKLETVDIPATMQYQLANIHFLELFHGDDAQGLDAIARALGHHDVTPGADAAPTSAAAPPRLSAPRKKLIGIVAAVVAALAAVWIVSALVPRGGGPGPGDHAAGPVHPPPVAPPAHPPVSPPATRPVKPPATRPVTPPAPPPPTAAPLSEAALKLAAVKLNVRWVKKGFLGDTDRTFASTAGVVGVQDGKLRLVTSSKVLGLRALGKSAKIKTYQGWVNFSGGESKVVERIADRVGKLDLALVEVDAAGLTHGTHYVLLPPVKGARPAAGEELVVLARDAAGDDAVRTSQKVVAAESLGADRRAGYRFDAAVNADNRGGLLLASRGGKFEWAGILLVALEPPPEGQVEPNVAVDAAEIMKMDPRWFKCDPAGAAGAAYRAHGLSATAAN